MTSSQTQFRPRSKLSFRVSSKQFAHFCKASAGVFVGGVSLAALILATPLSGALAGAKDSASLTQRIDVASSNEGNLIENRLQDIQIGERAQFTRIALVCRTACAVTQRNEEFVISGLSTSMTIDLSKRSTNAEQLFIERRDNVSILQVQSTKALLRSHIDPCTIRGFEAVCIDLEFTRNAYTPVREEPAEIVTATPSQSGRNPTKHRSLLRNLSPAPATPAPATQTSPVRTAELSTPLGLRDPKLPASGFTPVVRPGPINQAPQQGISNAEAVTPNSSFSPVAPSLAPKLASRPTSVLPSDGAPGVIQAAALPADRGTVLRPVETGQLLARVDFREYAESILDRRFDRDNCDTARDTLRADAWALDAMLTIGYCRAANGDFASAEDVFRRLLTQDPDNYQAMIGRALIAGVAGERSVARKFLNEALDTDPPSKIGDKVTGVIQKL